MPNMDIKYNPPLENKKSTLKQKEAVRGGVGRRSLSCCSVITRAAQKMKITFHNFFHSELEQKQEAQIFWCKVVLENQNNVLKNSREQGILGSNQGRPGFHQKFLQN